MMATSKNKTISKHCYLRYVVILNSFCRPCGKTYAGILADGNKSRAVRPSRSAHCTKSLYDVLISAEDIFIAVRKQKERLIWQNSDGIMTRKIKFMGRHEQ